MSSSSRRRLHSRRRSLRRSCRLVRDCGCESSQPVGLGSSQGTKVGMTLPIIFSSSLFFAYRPINFGLKVRPSVNSYVLPFVPPSLRPFVRPSVLSSVFLLFCPCVRSFVPPFVRPSVRLLFCPTNLPSFSAPQYQRIPRSLPNSAACP